MCARARAGKSGDYFGVKIAVTNCPDLLIYVLPTTNFFHLDKGSAGKKVLPFSRKFFAFWEWCGGLG